MRATVAAALALAVAAAAGAQPPAGHGQHQVSSVAPAATRAVAPPSTLPAGAHDRTPAVAPGAFAPSLALAGDDLLATWLEPLPAGGHRVRWARHRAGAWSPPVTVAEGADLFANWADTPGTVAAADGALYVWWLAKSAPATYAYDVRLARSTDGGATFSALGTLHDDHSAVEHGFVSAAAEGRGIRFYYLDGRATSEGGPMQLRSARVEGATIGASELVDAAVCDCCPTAATAWADGSAVAYRDRTPDEIRDIRLALRPGTGPGSQIEVGAERWRIEGCPVNGPALAAGRDRLAVAWFSAPADRARVAVAVGSAPAAQMGPAVLLDADRPLGRVAATALAEGFAVAWLARAGEVAELRVARIGDRGEASAPLAVARTSAGRASGVPRLILRGDDLWLAWTEPDGPGLRVASLAASALPRPPRAARR